VPDRCFTILRQQTGVQALQVLNRAGKWIDAPPIPGTFVINIADAMMRASSASFSLSRLVGGRRASARRCRFPGRLWH
jgi:isopenicillin N synthase-like dioxygenase